MAPSRSPSRSRRRLLLRAGGMIAAPLFILACNGIIGLSDYDRAECAGGGLCDGSTVDSGTSDTSAFDTGSPDVVKVDAGGSAPVAWAHFVMPNFNQGDGGPTDNIATYSPTTGGFVDNVSKLVWREPIPQAERGAKTYAEAEQICAKAEPAGQWRLPTRIELVTLLDFSGAAPYIDRTTFASTEPTTYWTSSETRVAFGNSAAQAIVEPKRWGVDFNGGGLTKIDINSSKGGVRCIKAK